MGIEQRIADRVPFRAPLRIVGRNQLLTAESLDLSRTGLRMRVALSAIGGAASDDLMATADAVDRVLGRHFAVELNHEIVGSLVAKASRIIRISAPQEGDAYIDLGCRFQEPLSSMETVVLGVPLPVERGSMESWIPRADVPSPQARAPMDGVHDLDAADPHTTTSRIKREPDPEPARRDRVVREAPNASLEELESAFERDVGGRSGWRAQITGTADSSRPPLVGNVARVDQRSVMLRVWRETEHAKDIFSADDVVSTTLAFAQGYGRELGLKLMDGATHLWTGPAIVTEIALPGNLPEDVYLSLSFARQLRPAELQRLGIA